MAAVEALCSSCMHMVGGRLLAQGDPRSIVTSYMTAELRPHTGQRSLVNHPGRLVGVSSVMRSVTLISGDGEPISVLRMGMPLSIRVAFAADIPIRPILGVNIKTAEGLTLFGFSNRWTDEGRDCDPVREGSVGIDFESLPLMPGTYFLDLQFGDFAELTRDLDVIFQASSFEVLPADMLGTGKLPRPIDGPVFWTGTWAFHNGAQGKT
jgi:hypothetical protein